ncbi:MAG: cysteine desulfurase [Oscillospiraceae bacterium]|nr:cysteine desulfurase [Oscillospiraceae bacterium]
MEIYLDHAATTRPASCVIEAVTYCLAKAYGNPSSLHRKGLEAQLVMDDARKTIAGALGCDPGCILFTSGATESSNLALRGAAAAYGKRKRHIVTSAVEHASVRSTIDALEAQGFTVTRVLPNAAGEFEAKDFIDAVQDDTCMISMMLAENETGRILPVQKVFRIVKKRFPDVITHCDAVQAFMKLPVKVNDLQADLLSISAHKIHGPKGCGALFIRRGVRVLPLVTGGKQEKTIRPGTESVPLIAGFGAAVGMMKDGIAERYRKADELRAYFLSRIEQMDGLTYLSSPEGTPYIMSISVSGIRSEIMLHYLESKEIYVSSGSACSKGTKSGVLSAYHIPDAVADSTLRISICEDTAQSELDALLDAIACGQNELIHK